jgi:hypothetical protein
VVSEPVGGPLDARQLELVAAARDRAKRFRRADVVATFNVWTLGIFAVLSVLFAAFDRTGLAVAVFIAVCAWNEARGRNHLRRLEARGLRILVGNQLVLLASLVAYAGWMLVATRTGPAIDPATMQESAQLLELMGGTSDPETLASLDAWVRTVSAIVYGSVIVAVVLFQGGTALYYHSCRKHLDAYLSGTPAWVVELLKRT